MMSSSTSSSACPLLRSSASAPSASDGALSSTTTASQAPTTNAARPCPSSATAATTTKAPRVASGEFRLLRHGRNTGFFANGYWVMTLSSPQTSRMITGIPEQLLAVGIRPASESPPALVSGSLHWLPLDPESAGTELQVFDTVRETFRRMRPPPAVDADGQAQTLLELNDKLTMTVTRGGLTTAQLWVLQEYAREDSWVCTLQVPLPAVNIVGDRPAAVAVMSQEGDVLVQCPQCLLQCDAMGTVRKHHQLEHHRTVAVPHMFKESLVPHASVNTTKITTGYGGIPLPPFFSDTNC